MDEPRGLVWITGASSGIGWASALVLARRGWTVAASARDISKLENLASRHENIRPYPLDVADAEARREVHARIVAELGVVDVLVNNAGYGMRGAVEEARMHELRDLYDVNVFAPLALAQLVLPAMRRRRFGRIINVSSVVGRVSYPISGLYSSSKFALEGWSDALRMEMLPWGVKVILVEPGPIKTKFGRSAKSRSEEKLNVTDSPYAPYYKRFLEGGVKGAGSPWSASTVAWAIRRAAEDAHPYVRYPVHYVAWIGPLLRAILPASVFDRALAALYGFEKGNAEVTATGGCMIQLELPGGELLELTHLLADFNGTLAVDGELSDGVKQRLRELSKSIEISIITSDTRGTVIKQMEGLPVSVEVVPNSDEAEQERAYKRERVTELDASKVVFLGNGSNDAGAIALARLSIVVLGPEGAFGAALRQAMMVVASAEDALDLLLKPQRLLSGLRY